MPRTLIFNEKAHSYKDDRDYSYTSVTTLVHKYVPEFDTVKAAKSCARKGQGRYSGKTYKEIIEMWNNVTDTALDKGNNRHNFLEAGVKDATGFDAAFRKIQRGEGQMYTVPDIMQNHDYGLADLDKLSSLIGVRYPKIWEAFEHYTKLGFKVYSEIVVYDEDYLVSGMIDILLVHPDGRFVILDWKTNKHDMKFEAGYYRRDSNQQYTDEWVAKTEYMKAPLDGMQHCNGNVYSMQLSTYARLCEKFGLKLEYIILAHIRENYQLNKYGMPYTDDNGLYIPIPEMGERVEFHPIRYYKGHVDSIMNHNYNKGMGLFGNM